MIISLGIIAAFGYLIAVRLPIKWAVGLLCGFLLLGSMLIIKRARAILLGLLIVSLPFRIDQILVSFSEMGGTSGLRVSLVDPILILILAFNLANPPAKIVRKMIFFSKISKIWLLLLFFLFVSYVSSGFPLRGLAFIIEVLRCFLVFIVIKDYFITETRILTALLLISFGVGIQGVISYLQFHNASLIEGLSTLGQSQAVYREGWQLAGQIRPGGTVGGPNDLAHYLIMQIPMVGVLLLAKIRPSARIFALICLVLGYVSLILTFSRIGWIAAIIGMACLAFLVNGKAHKKNDILKKYSLLVVILVIVIVVTLPIISQRLFSEDYGAAYSRIPMLANSLKAVLANPIFGVGINNYVSVSWEYDITGIYRLMGIPHPVHNVILLHFVELGILGGVIFCWLWAECFRQVYRKYKRTSGLRSMIAAGFLAAMISDFFFLQVQWGYIEGYLPFWLILGIILSTTAESQKLNNYRSPI